MSVLRRRGFKNPAALLVWDAVRRESGAGRNGERKSGRGRRKKIVDIVSEMEYNHVDMMSEYHSRRTNMPKGSPERTAARKEEIINACEKLYQTMSFKDITLKEIGSETSFSRPTIYNYFQTREEIFLALFEREYVRWNEELQRILLDNTSLTKEQIADKLATSLANRGQLLKLLAMNNYDMEANSRPELLTSFKVAYGNSMKSVRGILSKFCPEKSAQEIQSIIYVFFPFMFGIYPYTSVTQKQREAMTAANADFVYQSVYEITDNCLRKLL